MTTTNREAGELIATIWSDIFYEELKQQNILSPLFLRSDYEGEIGQQGDTIKVNQIAKPASEEIDLETADADAQTNITSNNLKVNQVEIKAKWVATCNVEFGSFLQLQGQSFEDMLRVEMFQAVFDQVETRIWAQLLASDGSGGTPDHQTAVASKNILTLDNIIAQRTLLNTQKVPTMDRWAVIGNMVYPSLLKIEQFTNKDYISGDNVPIQNGAVRNVLNFNVVESNSTPAEVSKFFHRSALAFVPQLRPQVKVSDMHAAGKRGYLASIDMVYAADTLDKNRVTQLINP